MNVVRVVFVEPNFPRNQREFVRALASVGAEVIGIGESPQEALDDALRAAGVPTAASTAADNAHQVQDFANAVGFPLILKPRSGAGAADTTRVDDHGQLDQVLASFGAKGVDSIAVEEFVEGHEGFYD